MITHLPRAALEAVRYALKDGGGKAARAALRDAVAPRAPRDFSTHLKETVGWLMRAHDATGRKGVARSYSLRKHRRYQVNGWLPAYPETTGYIIPTLFEVAQVLGLEEARVRACEMARWEAEIQMEDGAVRGGTVADPPSPAVFNTGQVMFGLMRAADQTKDSKLEQAAERAARWLVAAQDDDGVWRRGASAFVKQGGHVYNVRVAWALALWARRTNERDAEQAARRSADYALGQQNELGWFAENCLEDEARPLLHTIAYAIQGALEIGLVLGEQRYVDAARRAAQSLARVQRADGFIAGRFDQKWQPAADWCCLTGNSQMALVWDRLAEIDGKADWREHADRAARFVCATQKIDVADPGVRGGVAGSFPIWGSYGCYEYLNWAAKFAVDALLGRVTGRACGTNG